MFDTFTANSGFQFKGNTEFGDDILRGMDTTLLYGKTIIRDVMSRVMPRYFGGGPLHNMPISDFRKKKLLYVFHVFFDVNQSGTIDRKDFELAIEKVCSLRGWASGSEEYRRTFNSMIEIWEGLRQRADSNKDGQVSVEEWASMWDDYSKRPENALEWQTQYMRFMFELEDASGDGSIDVDEFTSVCSCYGLEAGECREAFTKMSQGQKNVTYEQFEHLWKQFFMSENPQEPGNYIFGKTRF